MLLLIDNYDSFTYNLYQYLAELGAEVVPVRNDKITLEEIEAMAPRGIVVSPGPCNAGGGRNFQRRHPPFWPPGAGSGCLPGPSVYGPGLWRHGGPGWRDTSR